MKDDIEKGQAKKPHPLPTSVDVTGQDGPPFKEFMQVLAFLASIGLAATSSCAFSLVGATSSLGNTSDAALLELKRTATLLSWSAAFFIVAIAIIVTAQLLYTEKVIVAIITKEEWDHWTERMVRIGVAVFAWICLAFQTAALFLFSQALGLISTGPMELARYGIVVGMAVVAGVTVIGMLTEKKGREKLRKWFLCKRQL